MTFIAVSVCPLRGLGHDSGGMNISHCPLCCPGSLPGCGRVFQGIIPGWSHALPCTQFTEDQRLGPLLNQWQSGALWEQMLSVLGWSTVNQKGSPWYVPKKEKVFRVLNHSSPAQYSNCHYYSNNNYIQLGHIVRGNIIHDAPLISVRPDMVYHWYK